MLTSHNCEFNGRFSVHRRQAVTTYLVFHLRDKFIVAAFKLLREGLGTNKKRYKRI